MAREKLFQPSPEMDALLVQSGSLEKEKSIAGVREVAKALETPLRQGVLNGDIVGPFNIFEPISMKDNASPEFPLHFLAPGTEKEYVAYSIPNHGYIPQKHIEGDYVMVSMYEIGSSIDWNLKYARDARWDVVGAATDVFLNGFTQKWNDDAWHTLITAAADRNLVVLDSDAGSGQLTKRLVSLMKLVMRRNGGGNSRSMNRGMLTDLFLSPEAMDDIRNWNVDQIDEITRRQILVTEGDYGLSRLFGVNLHDLDELGEGQEYQLFYENELGASLPAGDVELVVGLDLRKKDSFVMPVRQSGVSVFADESMHRMRRAGLYGWAEQGFGVLDNRRVILGSL